MVVDTETTGLDPEKDKICEIAGVWRNKDKLLFSAELCNPGVPIPPEVSAVHHITDDLLIDLCSPLQALENLLNYFGALDDCVMVAHNAKFDRGFLSNLVHIDRPWICTYRCALHLWPDAPGHSNQVLRYWLKQHPEWIPLDLAPHRALYDALCTEQILRFMLVSHSLDELIELSKKPVILQKVRFGKYKGSLWQDVDYGYLKWVMRQQNIDADVLHTAHHYLTKRTVMHQPV
jgi:exodeoxyribonuclease X